MVGVSCVPINGTARTIVLLSRSLVTNVGSLSDLLGFTWVSGKGELVFLFSFVLLVISVEKCIASRVRSPSVWFFNLDQLFHYGAYYQHLFLWCQCLYW